MSEEKNLQLRIIKDQENGSYASNKSLQKVSKSSEAKSIVIRGMFKVLNLCLFHYANFLDYVLLTTKRNDYPFSFSHATTNLRILHVYQFIITTGFEITYGCFGH